MNCQFGVLQEGFQHVPSAQLGWVGGWGACETRPRALQWHCSLGSENVLCVSRVSAKGR
jgi:hypothetical protein